MVNCVEILGPLTSLNPQSLSRSV